MVQIRYLKSKVTRESVFRADLSYQKHYLLSILSTLEKRYAVCLDCYSHADQFPARSRYRP